MSSALSLKSLVLLTFLTIVKADYTDAASDAEGCTIEEVGEWDKPLHIASIFVLLIASGIGVFLPVIFGDHSKNSLVGKASFVLKYFGSGIIISLA